MSDTPPPFSIFLTFLRLGCTSFGGPVAHIGFFRDELVGRQCWVSEAEYAEMVALAQFLPGPASSQVGMGLGLLRGGWWGLFAAWLGFTLPSAVIMGAFALGLGAWNGAHWISGLKIAAVAIVAQAVQGMWGSLITSRVQAGLALGVAALTLLFPAGGVQLVALLLCGVVGWRILQPQMAETTLHLPQVVTARTSGWLLGLFFAGLVLLPLLAPLGAAWAILDATYRAGALVFGGGHVVLPLLEQGFVPHFVSHERFLAGYGVANAVPGPLFTFASYLGAAQNQLSPAWGAVIATFGIFLPGALLLAGALPLWATLSKHQAARAALTGMNAGVVGLLLAALYQPVFTSAIAQPRDLALTLLAYGALTVGRLPSWLVVLSCAVLTGFFV